MHYGEFRTEYFVSLLEREAHSTLLDTGDEFSTAPAPVDSTFPLPFTLALAAIATATAAAAVWHL